MEYAPLYIVLPIYIYYDNIIYNDNNVIEFTPLPGTVVCKACVVLVWAWMNTCATTCSMKGWILRKRRKVMHDTHSPRVFNRHYSPLSVYLKIFRWEDCLCKSLAFDCCSHLYSSIAVGISGTVQCCKRFIRSSTTVLIVSSLGSDIECAWLSLWWRRHA